MTDTRKNVDPTTGEELSADVEWDRPVKFLWLMALIDRSIQRELQQALAPLELSLNEYSTLAVLHTRPGLSNAELARRSLVTPQSQNEVVSRLERRGLVERHKHPDHGRILMTEVTATGRAVLDEAMTTVKAFEAELVDGIPAEAFGDLKDQLAGMLSRLIERPRAS